MHIVLLSDYETQGGAAVAASRLAEGLCGQEQVTRLVLYPDGQLHPWRTWPLKREPVARLWRRFVAKIVPSVSRTSPLPQPAEQLRRALHRLRPDVINVHNLHGGGPVGWGPELVAVCAEFAPVAWTLHDMWSFTGRCAYAYDCTKFRTGCDAGCPTADEHPTLAPNKIAPAWEQRRRMMAALPGLTAITPSRWLAGEARAGLWAGHRIEVIPYGLPIESFRPLERAFARRALGIPEDRPVVCSAAKDLTERRKGAQILPHVWSSIRRPLTVVTMGLGEVSRQGEETRVIPFGWVNDVEKQVLLYNAADVLLHPAPVDNFPNVVLEALACATPAVALPTCGLPELVRPGISGWLAPEMSGLALAQTVDQALDDIHTGRDLRDSCRRLVEREFSLALQARRYHDLFVAFRSAKGCAFAERKPTNSDTPA